MNSSNFSSGTNAEKLGIEVPEGTKVLGATATVVGKGDDLCREKLCPVINIMPYGTFEEGVADMVKNLEFEGKGHSVAIHSNNPEHVEYCGIHCSLSRCIFPAALFLQSLNSP